MSRHKSLRERRQEQHAAKVRAARLRWLAIIGAVLLLSGALMAFGAYREGSLPAVDDLSDLAPQNKLGPTGAPVSIVEFSDFDCPSCRAWHNSGMLERLFADFGDQISFTFRHYPVITAQSPKAAEAAQCAAEQGAFWEYHDYLYEEAAPSALARADLERYAVTLGLNGEEFTSCLESGQMADYVARDQQAARLAGLRGTPSFFVNGQQVSFFSYETMAAAVREALN